MSKATSICNNTALQKKRLLNLSLSISTSAGPQQCAVSKQGIWENVSCFLHYNFVCIVPQGNHKTPQKIIKIAYEYDMCNCIWIFLWHTCGINTFI